MAWAEHTLKTKWTHFKSHKIKVIAIVYCRECQIDDFQPWMNIRTLVDDPWTPCPDYIVSNISYLNLFYKWKEIVLNHNVKPH